MRWLAISVGILPLAASAVRTDLPSAGSAPPLDYAQARLGRPGQGAGLLAAGFPEDVYAQPAFEVAYDHSNPVRRSAAIALLEGPATHHTLFRSGLAQAHLCHIPQPRAVPPWERPHSAAAFLRQNLTADQANSSAAIEHALDAERQRIIVRGLELLEPMKQYCIYLQQPAEWFTYSFCHGKAVRQFRSKPETSVALISAVRQHMETARASGGEVKGDYRLVGGLPRPDGQGTTYKFAVSTPQGEESFVYVTPQEPLEDTSSASYVLGKWQEGVERVAGTDLHFSQLSRSPTPLPVIDVSDTLSQGTELIEVVRLGTRDEQRYLSQLWVDGVRCNLNGERRMVEIQYHCAETGKERVSLIKEVTTCNYVLVIETPRLCAEPAFLPVKQDAENYVTCRKIVPDDWQPPPPPHLPQTSSPSLKPPHEAQPSTVASGPELEGERWNGEQADQLVLAPPQDADTPETERGTVSLGPAQGAVPLEAAAQVPPREEDDAEDTHTLPSGPASEHDNPTLSQVQDAAGGEKLVLSGDTSQDAHEAHRDGPSHLRGEEDGDEMMLTFLGLNEDGIEEEQDFVVTADELEALGMGHLMALTEDGNNAEVEIGWDLFEYLQERERLNAAAAVPPPADQPVAQAEAQDAPDSQLMTTLVDAIGQYLKDTSDARQDGAQHAGPRHEAERDTVRDWVRRYKESIEQHTQSDLPAPEASDAKGATLGAGQGAGGGDGDEAAGKRDSSTRKPPPPPRKVQPSLYERISVFYSEDGPSASATAPPTPPESAAAPKGGVPAAGTSEWDHTNAEGDSISR